VRTRFPAPALAALLTAALSVQAALPDLKPPQAPHIRKGACPLECCTLGAWTARVPLQAYRHPAGNAARAFALSPGESFEALSGDLHTLQLGFVMVLKPFQKQGKRFDPGDIFYILSYQAWDYLIWQRGQVLGVPPFWGVSDGDPDRETALLKAEPVMVWWVQVRNAAGTTGWLPLRLRPTPEGMTVVEDIDDMNDCG
jgi:hypothetical protein